MLLITDYDEHTEKLSAHLRSLSNGEVNEDKNLLNKYMMEKTDGTNFYSYKSPEEIEYNHIVKNLASLLIKVILSASDVYLELLRSLIEGFSSEQLLKYISLDMLTELTRNPATQELLVDVLEYRIDSHYQLYHFIQYYDLLYPLVAGSLESNEAHYDSRVNECIHMCISDSLTENIPFKPEKFEFLTNIKQEQNLTGMRFKNYVQIIISLKRIGVFKQPWSSKLFPFEFSKVLEFENLPKAPKLKAAKAKAPKTPKDDDEDESDSSDEDDDDKYDYDYEAAHAGASTDLLDIYLEWSEHLPFAWMKPYIGGVLEYVVSNYPEWRASGDIHNDTQIDTQKNAPDFLFVYQLIFQKLFWCEGEAFDFAFEYVASTDADVIQGNKPTPFGYAEIRLGHILDKEGFYNSHFAEFDIKSDSQFMRECLHAMVREKDFFRLLVESKNFTSENLKTWRKDDLLEILSSMAGLDHCSKYMVSELCEIILEYILKIDPMIFPSSDWELQKGIVSSLLIFQKKNLGVWKDPLSDCLREMNKISGVPLEEGFPREIAVRDEPWRQKDARKTQNGHGKKRKNRSKKKWFTKRKKNPKSVVS